jgi:hypothetical protein
MDEVNTMRTQNIPHLSLSVLLLFLLTACSSTEVTSKQAYEGKTLPRPNRIFVEDFVATPLDVPPGSPLAANAAQQPTMSEEEQATARKLGAAVSTELVKNLQGMGLPAVRASGQPSLATNDILLRGYFLSIKEGTAGERIVVGFGEGAAELKTAVEGYQMTPQGLRRLGGGQLKSGGQKTPGVIAPLAVVAATGNPLGLLVNAGMQAADPATVQNAAKHTADEIFTEMRPTIERQGWKY